MEKLCLGVARQIITPKIGGQLFGYRPDVRSTTLEDDLTVTAFCFSQGNRKAMMLSATVCLIQTALAEEILTAASSTTGIPKDHILLSATHTHSGPNTSGMHGWGDIDRAYCDEIFIPAIVRAAEQAAENSVPVKMFAAAGVSHVGINRRELPFDSNDVILGQNPWGPFNPNMTVLSFKTEQGHTMANLIHYGCHGTAAGMNTEITRDWSGIMTDELEAATGGITAFFCGAEGDVGPRLSNGKTTGDLSHVHELGHRAAADALRIYETSREQAQPTLAVKSFAVSIPLKPRIGKTEAEIILQRYKGETVNREGLICRHLECALAAHEANAPEDTHFTFRQTLLQLGDFVFTSYPFELFSEIAMRVDSHFKDKTILDLAITNGSEGYFVTEDAICRGGYEVDMHTYGHSQSYEKNADLSLIKSVIENIRRMDHV